MGTISKYDINNMIVWYGIDNAVTEYNNYYGISNIDVNDFTKSLLTFLILLSFKVEYIDH
jgi:hypothetical protein